MLSCAIHEIGHILGLKHSTVDGTIMWPLLQNGLHTLHHDDIDSVQALYGFKINGTPRKDEQGGRSFKILTKLKKISNYFLVTQTLIIIQT